MTNVKWSFVSEAENGEGDELWNDKPNKKHPKDIDTSWAQKGEEEFFGYKVSAKVDGKSKFVKKIVVTTASPHDSKMSPDMKIESDKGRSHLPTARK